MNFRIQTDPPAIVSTGAATDGSTVFGSLKMARAALDDAVEAAIESDRIVTEGQVERLQRERRERAGSMRIARKAALKVREADLPSEPAAPAEAA